jgi:hypothetical protein
MTNLTSQTTTQTPRRRRAPWLLAAALCLAITALAIPAAASADSILYTKGGDIWLSSPDGANQFQVTSGGGYSYASQSESGEVIVAAREFDNRLFVLNRNGDLVREVPTVIGSSLWHGPFEPQVSPNGAHVAYQYFYTGGGETRTGVAYANTDGTYGEYDLHTGWGYPAWYDDSLLMHSDPPNGLSQDVILRGFGSLNNTGEQWFSHDEFPLLHDGDIRANAMAFVSGQDGENLPVYRFDGEPGGDFIEICYAYQGPNGKFESPSFSPDRSSLSWDEADGIHVSPSGIDSDCHPEQVSERLTIPGGRYPDWGAAAVPGPRPTDTGNPNGGGAPTGGTPNGGTTPSGKTGGNTNKGGTSDKGNGGDNGTAKASLRIAGKPKLGPTLKKGLTVTVAGASGKVALTATVPAGAARKTGLGKAATKVASGSAIAKGATTTVRLRFTAKAARKLARLGSVQLRISGVGVATTATLKR